MTAAGYETNKVVAGQLRDLANKMSGYKESIAKKALAVSDLQNNSSNKCSSTFLGQYSQETGIPQDVLFSLTSISNQPTDDDLIGFINKVKSGYYDQYLPSLKSDKFCGASLYFARAIEMARNLTNPAKSNRAVAVLKVEDPTHPLIQGISQSIDLVDRYGNPVPFVLVATGAGYTHVVASLEITPAYKGERLWPAITVRDPKYGTHVFGRGVVVYYAFPPEISPVLMNDLVKFILY